MVVPKKVSQVILSLPNGRTSILSKLLGLFHLRVTRQSAFRKRLVFSQQRQSAVQELQNGDPMVSTGQCAHGCVVAGNWNRRDVPLRKEELPGQLLGDEGRRV